MNSNELRDHIRELNQQHLLQQQQRRQLALEKIRELRRLNKYIKQGETDGTTTSQ